MGFSFHLILGTDLCFVEFIDSETVEVNTDLGMWVLFQVTPQKFHTKNKLFQFFRKLKTCPLLHVSILTSWLNSSVERNETWHSFLEFFLLIFCPYFPRRNWEKNMQLLSDEVKGILEILFLVLKFSVLLRILVCLFSGRLISWLFLVCITLLSSSFCSSLV